MAARIQVPSRLKLPTLAMAALLSSSLGPIVSAESEETLDALVKEAGAACQIASELEQSRVVWSSPEFEHNAALIIAGKWPPTRNNGADAYMLCLFDKQTAKVEIQEIKEPLFK